MKRHAAATIAAPIRSEAMAGWVVWWWVYG
jgi:hypothetical protein